VLVFLRRRWTISGILQQYFRRLSQPARSIIADLSMTATCFSWRTSGYDLAASHPAVALARPCRRAVAGAVRPASSQRLHGMHEVLTHLRRR
jgi:hypothetical protein